MDETEFLEKLESMTLSPEMFDHKGHLWLGWLYIRDLELGDAANKLNSGIKKYAASLGATDKFHYTLTTTFACAIKYRYKNNETFEQFLESNDDLVKDAISVIQTHYSPELLFSPEAKVKLVKPDREPFPKEFETQLEKFAV
ncbi:MAG: hypothetical protein CL677_07775 [Bdellovibrionaceae bacterium]|nr:hypothetical protein [Pseudobdellovibrionaceae bacterium]|tara:strand:+ start:20789 stop:21214 length:426 start_codon:yes stop_codon:yes gene_type:complete